MLSQDCAGPAGHIWTLVIGYFLSLSQTTVTLKRGDLGLSMLLSLVRTSQPFLLLTLVLYPSHTQILHLKLSELLLRFVPQSPKSPLAVLPVGQRVISHTGNWVWDVCLMPSRLQFMPSGTFYKFSGIQGQCTGVSQGRKYQGLYFLITVCIFKEVFLVLLRKKWGLYIHSHLVLCLGFFFPPVVSLFSHC